RPASFKIFKCCETVDCAKDISSTISPQMQEVRLSSNNTIRTRAGCASAQLSLANSSAQATSGRATFSLVLQHVGESVFTLTIVSHFRNSTRCMALHRLSSIYDMLL